MTFRKDKYIHYVERRLTLFVFTCLFVNLIIKNCRFCPNDANVYSLTVRKADLHLSVILLVIAVQSNRRIYGRTATTTTKFGFTVGQINAVPPRFCWATK